MAYLPQMLGRLLMIEEGEIQRARQPIRLEASTTITLRPKPININQLQQEAWNLCSQVAGF